jgi:hypothetical protein
MTELIASQVCLISFLVKVGWTKNINEVSPNSFVLTNLSFGLNPVVIKCFF